MEAVLNMETVEEKLARAWSTTDDRKIWNCTYAGMVIRGTRELLTEEEHIFGRKLR